MSEVWTKVATIRAYGNSGVTITTWTPENVYSCGDFAIPTNPNDRIYECLGGGTSGETEPNWPLTIGSTILDGTITWFCTNTFSTNPLTVVLDTGGIGGAPYKDIWVRIPGVSKKADFIVYGSHSGLDSCWRQIDEITVPQDQRDNRHIGLQNAYRFIKVVAEESVDAEIEIVAGE